MSGTIAVRTLRAALCAATALSGGLSSAPAFAQASDPRAAPPELNDMAAPPSLDQQFKDPPQSARPRVWWHWMNGNITEDGIAKDLAWMKRVGIGGLQNFDANLMTPQIVKNRLVYMTPEWKHAFRFAASEADRLGLELAIAASPGWSETGGPWVPPEDGLKKLVWSETMVEGGHRFTGALAAPPAVTGPYQNIAMAPGMEAMMSGGKSPPPPVHYADVAVLAFPVAAEARMPQPRVTGSDGQPLDGAALTDGDLNSFVLVKGGGAGSPTLTLDYPSPQAIRSATLFMPGAAMMFFGATISPRLEASDDGKIWRSVAEIPAGEVPTTVSFAPVTARSFRVVFAPKAKSGPDLGEAAPGVAMSFGDLAAGKAPVRVGELRLSGEARIDHAESKAGFQLEPDYYALSAGLAETAGVAPDTVIDLTSHLRADGTLDWVAPRGHWRVLRLGTSLLGTTNHPASREATGLEVDKFDGAAVRRYLEYYLGMYHDAAGNDLIGAHGVRAMLTDSIEVGAANWTPQMLDQFRKLRGYDPTPWLPALTGTIIGSRTRSDAFLYDYRRTLADLMASEHYGTVAAVAHENGLKLYGEALEDGRPSLGDDIAMRSHTDVPMAAMWTFSRKAGPKPTYIADIKGAASVAHIYGQNLVAAESMTASMNPWAYAPDDLRRVIDLEFVTGVNRPVIHTSVHQPTDDKLPGLSLFIFGQYFNRHETWAEMARPWIDYIARNSLLLQQGRNVADVGYFYGEEAALTGLYGEHPVADAPKTSAYDFVNADALASALANDGTELVTPGGARYRALYLGGSSRHMTLAALRRLDALVENGATIVGPKPEGSPSLAGDAADYAALTAKLWPGGEETVVGKGRVIASTDIEAALRRIGVGPDFSFTGGAADSDIPFVHRKFADGDSYFLVNRLNRPETIEAHFRIAGKAPELWHADTGRAELASYRIEKGETIVPLSLAAEDSVHVVFRRPTYIHSLTIVPARPVVAATLDGAWSVNFQAGRGAPASAVLPTLAPLDANAVPGIRYFSGVATYAKDFTAPRGWKRGKPLWIDLGEVRELAEVSVNGRSAGIVWHTSYRIDIGALAKAGKNHLEISVANLWVNRLIGDAQPGAQKITWTPLPTYKADAPLRRSGLIGPVELLIAP